MAADSESTEVPDAILEAAREEARQVVQSDGARDQAQTFLNMGLSRRQAMKAVGYVALGATGAQAIVKVLSEPAAAATGEMGTTGDPLADIHTAAIDGGGAAISLGDDLDDGAATLIDQSVPAWASQVGLASSPVAAHLSSIANNGSPVTIQDDLEDEAGNTWYDESANAIDIDEIVDVWAGSALQTNYPFPKWGMGSSSGSGSVTFTATQIQLREPGDAASREESRAFDDFTGFDPSVPGRVRIHVSGITIDNNTDARIKLQIDDAPDTDQRGSDVLEANIRGDGDILALTAEDGSSSFSTDTTQNNAYVSGLNTIQIAWDGSTLTVTTDDGNTTVTVSESGNYPSGENLLLKISVRDNSSASARNADVDVDAIDVGT